MTNTMNQSKARSSTNKATRPTLIALAVFCTLIFMCVYFDLTSSANMVDTRINKYLMIFSAVCFMYSFVFYKPDKEFPKKAKWIAVCSVVTFAGCIFIENFSEQTAYAFMLYGLAIIALFALYLKRDSLTWEKGAYLIIACGCVMAIGHSMGVPETLDLHDSDFGGSFEESFGHANYIGYILNNWSLPDTNTPVAYYQPPLFHIIAAMFFKINQLLGLEYRRCAENINLLTGLYSCLNTVVWYKILKQFKLKRAALLIPLAIIALHPTSFIMGNSTSNDMLMWLFVALCILYLVKWYHDPTMKNIIIVALCLGLGMMTKVSAVMLAPAIAFVFLYKLIQHFKKKTYITLVPQFFAFGFISIPIGMFHPIRNLIKFGQSLGYVPNLGDEHWQYLGDIPLLDRIIPLSLKEAIASPFVIWGEGGDFNLFIKALKTSLFGETAYAAGFSDSLASQYLLTVLNYLLIILSLAAIVYVLVTLSKSRSKPILYYFLAVYYVTLIIMMISFAIKFPHQCTLDIRYIAATIPIGALFIGKMCNIMCLSEKYKKAGSDNGTESAKASNNFKAGVASYTALITVMFCIVSVVIFLMDSYYRVFW